MATTLPLGPYKDERIILPIKNLREDRRPADLWFWNDWFSSFDVKICSLSAQGLWVNMLGVMRNAEKKGSLTVNGKQIGSKELMNITGASEGEIIILLEELESRGVFSRLEDGTIINRRMYREGELSRKRAFAGRLGGLNTKQNESKDESKSEATLEYEDEYEYKEKDKEGECEGEIVSSNSTPTTEKKNNGRKTGHFLDIIQFSLLSESEIEEKFKEFWNVYPPEGRLAKKESRIKFGALVKRGELPEFIKGFHGYLDFLKHERIKNKFELRPMYAKTFLNGRWSEFVGFKYEPEL